MSQFFRQVLTLTLVLISASMALARTQTNSRDQEESSRQIVLDRFNKARPAADMTAGVGGSRAGPNKISVKPPVYRRTGQTRLPVGRKSAPASAEEIGVTVWRLRPSQSADTGARVLVRE